MAVSAVRHIAAAEASNVESAALLRVMQVTLDRYGLKRTQMVATKLRQMQLSECTAIRICHNCSVPWLGTKRLAKALCVAPPKRFGVRLAITSLSPVAQRSTRSGKALEHSAMWYRSTARPASAPTMSMRLAFRTIPCGSRGGCSLGEAPIRMGASPIR